ncbi:MAG: type I restriction endonuclease subunit R, partial [bacterium]|nr:type I restriction endonuclease subunit R [bacterium]
MNITEDQLEQLSLEWFQSIGYDYICGYDIAPSEPTAERSDYRQIILHDRLLSRIEVINPHIPLATLEQVTQLIAKPETPILIKNNKAFHQLLLEGVKVEYKQGDQDKTDYVQLIDFATISNNQFLVVNQYTITGSKGNRRPDVIVFINGLPLAVLELKN